ncbi:LamG domain-containing protein [Candidatus Gottesmanbacteria bacterium]|nr:LamG domain-containing protein [Candidatus Gottesmanbacteria bacterium]
MKKFLAILVILLSFSFVLPIFFQTKAQSLISNYLELNGGYVKATNANSFPPPAFTFEAWVKPNSISGIQKILSVGTPSGDVLAYEVSINGGSLSLTYRHGSGGQVTITSGQLSSGVWSHIAVTIDSTKTRLFINGTQVTDPTITISTLKPIGTTIILGGSYTEPFGNPASFKGAIDEVRLSKVVRDVAGLWSSGAYDGDLLGDDSTVVMWRMDQLRGTTTVVDSTPNGIDGTMIGGDSLIHFFGVIPTPTPYTLILPTLRWIRPILPTLSFPFPTNPTSTPQPTSIPPTPTESVSQSRHLQLPRSFSR